MNLILDEDVRETVRAFALTNFNAAVLSAGDALRLTGLGLLGRVDASALPARLRRPLCTDMTTLMASAMLLHFDETTVASAEIAALLLSTTQLHDEMVPYLNAHGATIVQVMDADLLLCLLSLREDYDGAFESITPLKPFYACAAARLAADSVSALHVLHVNPVLALGLRAEDTPTEELARVLAALPEQDVYEVYRHLEVPAPLLLELYATRGILPRNAGLRAEEDVTVLVPILEDFMRLPRVDFSAFLSERVLRHEEMREVMLELLCVHDARRAIRDALLSAMSYEQLVARVGLIAHACVGTTSEAYEFRCPATRLTHASLRELKFVLDHVTLYVNVLGLQEDLSERVLRTPQLWEYNPNACLYALDREHTEELYLRALAHSRELFSDFTFVTGAMLNAILERGLFNYTLLRDLVTVERLVPHRYEVLRLEDVCLEPHCEMLLRDEMLDAYACKFATHAMYLALVARSPLPLSRKLRLLQAVPPNTMPMCRLLAGMHRVAYQWSPRYVLPTYVAIATADHELPADVDPHYPRLITLRDNVLLQLGPGIRRKMHVHEVARQACGGLRSVPEREHMLVQVRARGGTAVALQYSVALPVYATMRAYIVCLAQDLMALLTHGLFFRVMLWPPPQEVAFEGFGAAAMLTAARRAFQWDAYRTVNDELVSFSAVFVCCNHYLARVRVYVYYAMQYFAYCLLTWRDHAPADSLLLLLEELVPLFVGPGALRVGAPVLLRASAELEEFLLRGGRELRAADVLLEDLFAEFVAALMPTLH
ncbi:IEV morphogenesis protein [Equine molluscum contagiosum-like virus]|nr:IEV morphogenesis protein [Equine molluscum contagiosum-like virus]